MRVCFWVNVLIKSQFKCMKYSCKHTKNRAAFVHSFFFSLIRNMWLFCHFRVYFAMHSACYCCFTTNANAFVYNLAVTDYSHIGAHITYIRICIDGWFKWMVCVCNKYLIALLRQMSSAFRMNGIYLKRLHIGQYIDIGLWHIESAALLMGPVPISNTGDTLKWCRWLTDRTIQTIQKTGQKEIYTEYSVILL